MPVDTPVPRFDEVYRAHFDFVWRLLRRAGVDPAALEDAAQEVFLIVLRKLPEFDGRASVRTWLFEIAQNVARNQRRTVRRKGGLDPLHDDLVHQGRGPAETAADREALDRVLAVMETMDEESRIVLWLTEMEQMTAPEVGEIVGANVNTVSSRLRRARTAFHTELRRRGWAGDV